MRQIFKYFIMFSVTGIIYYLIEFIWKRIICNNNSALDWRMLVLSGLLCLIIGTLNNIFTYDTDFLLQGFIGSLIITLAEAISGYEWNTVQHLNIWDYSALPLSFVAGNVSIIFTICAWIPLSWIAIILMDYMDWKWFGYMANTPPYYKIFGKTIFRFKELKKM